VKREAADRSAVRKDAADRPHREKNAAPAASAPAAAAVLRSDLGFHLGRAYRTLRACWEDTIADLGLTPSQAAVLRSVTEGESCGLRALARSLGTDVMNARRLVGHLEGAGLVYSIPDPDHSQRHVIRPTAAGVAASEEVARRAAAVDARLRGLFGDRDLTRLVGLLDRLQYLLNDLASPLERGEPCAPATPERNE
jgi:DNA-binding MarR family transcriptional regulator